MMLVACEMLEGETHRPLIGVTVLTSMSLAGLRQLGIERDLEFMLITCRACSWRRVRWGRLLGPGNTETPSINRWGDFCLVTPGIRPRGRIITIRHAS